MIKLTDLKPSPYKLFLDIPNHPEVKDVFIEIEGTDSKDYAIAAAKVYKERGGKTEVDIDIDRALTDTAKLAASLIIDWGPNEFFGGVFTPKKALDILMDYDNKWIKEQIEQAAQERSNFFPK